LFSKIFQLCGLDTHLLHGFNQSSVFFVDVPTLVDVPMVQIVPATGNVIIGGSVGAKEVARVEDTTLEIVGMTV